MRVEARFMVLKVLERVVAAPVASVLCSSHSLLFPAMLLTRVGAGELLKLLGLHHRRASDLDGALSGHRGHLGRRHAEG